MSTKKTPRPYQAAAIESVLLSLREHPILVAPTGAGKTFMGVEIVHRTNARTLWVAHRRELIHQACDAIEDAGGRCGMILSGEREDRDAPIQVASVQTLARRDLPPADLLVIDEAHHAPSESYKRLRSHYPVRLGLTATPFRLDGKGLGTAGFGKIIVAAYTDDLCADETLHEPTVYAAKGPDLSSVKKTAGDYNLAQLSSAVEGAALTGRIVATWQKRASGRRTVAFAVSIAHAETIVRSFLDVGVRAEIVTGETPKAERAATLARLAAGITLVVVNVGVLTEGWDLPALEVAIIARPTASLCLHLQQIGRIMRSCEGKEGAIVLDHAGNYERHGLVTERLVYSLEGKVKKKPGSPVTKSCPECAKVIPAGCRECPECGYEFEREDKTTESDEELLPVGHKDDFSQRQRRYAAFVQEGLRITRARSVGGFFGWDEANTTKAAAIAAAKYKARYGTYPLDVKGRLIDPAHATPIDWALLREKWRSIGLSKGWTSEKIAWFVQKCESEARGSSRKAGAA